MATPQFNKRFEEIRDRFAVKFDAKMEDTAATLPHLSGQGTSATAAVLAAYIQLHQFSGSGMTLGFTLLGQAAAQAELILLEPFRAGRALTNSEVEKLTQALELLRVAARIELKLWKIERGQKL